MYRREAGITLIGGILILIIAGVLVLALARIAPLYFETFKITSAMDALRDNAQNNPIQNLRAELSQQLTMNSIDDVPVDQFKFTSNGGQLIVSLDHNLKTSYIGNLGFVVHYQHSVTIALPENE
ncbi:MAG: DUF4845 domain-containing protein [Gammaproteobacteria bacterium]